MKTVTSYPVIVGLALCVSVGVYLTYVAGETARKEKLSHLESISSMAAASLDKNEFHKINPVKKNKTFLKVKEELYRLKKSSDDIKYVYIIERLKDGKMIFLVDDVLESDPASEPSGDEYKDAPKELVGIFKKKSSIVVGPYDDKWGKFMSGFVPITTSRGEYVVGVDIRNQDWEADIRKSQVGPFGITLVLAILIVVFYILHIKKLSYSAKLEASESQYRTIFDNSQVGIFRTRLRDGYVIDCNDRFAQMFGFINKEQIQIEKFKTEDSYVDKTARQKMLQSFKNGIINDYEIFVRKQSGEETCLMLSGKICSDNISFTGVCVDMTERKEIEKAYRASEKRYSDFANCLPQIVFGIDTKGYFTFLNKYGAEALGYTDNDISQVNIIQIISNDQRPEIINKISQMTVTTEAFEPREYVLLKKNGNTFHAYLHSTKIFKNGHVDGLVGVAIDVTEMKKAEHEKDRHKESLMHMEKLATIGTLAAGVAHEVNNPLAIIQGHLDLLRKENKDDKKTIGRYALIDSAIQRISKIVSGLKTFARIDSEKFETVNVHKTIEDVMLLMETIIQKAGIKIQVTMHSRSPIAQGSHGKLEQVLMNLVSNARDALKECRKENPVIKIETRDISDEYVEITVEDNGPGIHKEIMTKIFDPFFTTKPLGVGTGMGLSICQSIIRSFGGSLTVSSVLYKETIFTIKLSRSFIEELNDKPPTVITKSEIPNNTVLIVDDEAFLREYLRDQLVGLGYEVEEAADGLEGLAKIQFKEYAAVVTDIKMPKMSGDALIMEARKQPTTRNTKFYVFTGDMVSMYKDISDGYITKPFTSGDVTRIFQDVREKKS